MTIYLSIHFFSSLQCCFFLVDIHTRRCYILVHDLLNVKKVKLSFTIPFFIFQTYFQLSYFVVLSRCQTFPDLGILLLCYFQILYVLYILSVKGLL